MSAPAEVEPVVTAAEVAKHYSVHPRTVLHWKTRGLIPCIQVGHTVRFRMSEVIAAIEKPAAGKGAPR